MQSNSANSSGAFSLTPSRKCDMAPLQRVTCRMPWRHLGAWPFRVMRSGLEDQIGIPEERLYEAIPHARSRQSDPTARQLRSEVISRCACGTGVRFPC